MKNPKEIPESSTMTVEEYLTEREMSSIPVLLVEGDDDSIFFQLICDELKKDVQNYPQFEKILAHIEIETPIVITTPQKVAGNRREIEYICKKADEINFTGLLVGYVDREFREFYVTIDSVSDNCQFQNRISRILWSRGHSIENYFFDVNVLHDGLRDYGISPEYQVSEALELFEGAINLRCDTLMS